jgi:F0F1-type ATP synthase assembly protein I
MFESRRVAHDVSRRVRRNGRIVRLLLVINVLIIVVVGAILFWVVDKFVRDGRLGNLLKILVVLFCLGAILVRVLPLVGGGTLL